MSRFILDASTVLTCVLPRRPRRSPANIDQPPTADTVSVATQVLCRKHGLTAYDAAYLELAVRYSSQMATVNDDLRRPTVAESVQLV